MTSRNNISGKVHILFGELDYLNGCDLSSSSSRLHLLFQSKKTNLTEFNQTITRAANNEDKKLKSSREVFQNLLIFDAVI